MQVIHRHILIILFGGLFLVPLASPPMLAQKGVQKKQRELKELREEIEKYEKRIKEGERRERSTLQRIDDYDRQTSLIRDLLSRLSEEIAANRREIKISQLNLATAEKELRQLKREYARTIVSMYKRGRTHDTELLLSSKSVNEMFIRSKYLKAYTERQRQNAAEIRRRKEKIETEKMLLEEKLHEQELAIKEKRQEESSLKRKVNEHKQLLAKVRQDVQSYEKQLKRKQAAARKVERMIADLIERERKRIEAERRAMAKKKGKAEMAPLPNKPISNTAFGRLRGRLPWPVSKGSVVGFFGEHTNPRWGTVTISNGIDVAVPSGTSVRSVADGVVSIKSFIAGYGNLLIINHEDGFRTVYAHLSEITVREQQKIKAGQVIGRSGEGVTGPVLHFQLWYEKIKQDPLLWLAKR